MNVRILVACAGLTALCFVCGCNQNPVSVPNTPVGPPPMRPAGVAVPQHVGWTMDFKQIWPPNEPIAGRVGGQEFKPDKVELQGDGLTFRTGKEFFADREIKLFLGGDFDSFEDLKIEVKPDQGFSTDTPHVHMAVKKTGDGLPDSKTFMEKYAMKLQLGRIVDDKLAGNIHLCLPDNDKSYLAGRFIVNVKGLGASKITGNVSLPAGKMSIALRAAYLGHDLNKQPHSGFVGFNVGDGDGYASSFASKLETKDGAVRFRHARVPAGAYLVVIGWDKRALAWKWVEVKDRGEVQADLAVAQGGTGDAELTLPAGTKDRRVSLLPLDADGKLPAGAGDAGHLAMQLSNYVRDMSAEAPAGQDKVTFTGLRPGTYRAVAGKATAEVVVKPGAVAQASLK